MNNSSQKIGVWIIGCGGAVATTTIVGTCAIARGQAPKTGMVTETSLMNDLPFVDPDSLVFGGCELYPLDLNERIKELNETSELFREKLIDRLDDQLQDISERCEPGLLPLNHDHLARPDSDWARQPNASAMEAVDFVRDQIRTFREKSSVDRLVVMNLASTEPRMTVDLPEEPDHYLSFLKDHDQTRAPAVPPSVLYATASFLENTPYVNFTPSPGNSLPALARLAKDRGIPHMGKDAKTGETLLKTVLAPMFRARNLKVLSWEGHNILGNEDGKTLENEEARKTKTEDKQKALNRLFGDEELHSRVRIDYVPSLGDWKTAWDFIHFEGFLGTKMSLQFIWQGSDSALAAPLVLDLIRFAELAERRGEAGEMTHLASFFKTPLGYDEHNFHRQFEDLLKYVQDVRSSEQNGK